MIQKEFQEKLEVKLIELNYQIDDIMNNLDCETSKCKCKLINLFQKGLEKEIKKGKYKVEMNVLFNFSFLDRFKIKIYNFYPKIIFHNFLFILLFFKSKKKYLDIKLKEFEEQFTFNYTRMKVNITRSYKDILNNTKNKFEELLYLSCNDLNKIEKNNWENLKKRYKAIKKELIQLSKKPENEY